jgi:hypothetical protein
VKGAVKGNYVAVKDPKGAVISAESSREGSAGPGNPGGHRYAVLLHGKCLVTFLH